MLVPYFNITRQTTNIDGYKMKKKILVYTVHIILFVGFSFSHSSHAANLSDMDKCLLEIMQTAGDDMTMGQARDICRRQLEDSAKVKPAASGQTDAEKQKAVDERLAADKSNVLKPFTLMAHKPNYVLLGTYNASGYDPTLYRLQYNDPSIELKDQEIQFQISIKSPLAIGLFKDTTDLYFAYTNRSFWQFYSKDISSPFRETNHEPEAWFQFTPEWEFMGFRNPVNAFGIVHQSNGQGGVLSRSWHRLYAYFVIERGNLALSLKPWYRINEKDEDDDNPDITDYLGHGELRAAYKLNRHTFSLMLRNNLESGFKRGAVEAGWSFPLWKYKYFKGYMQYFSGYGESMIDYNRYVNRIGIGILLSDFL